LKRVNRISSITNCVATVTPVPLEKEEIRKRKSGKRTSASYYNQE